jgi:hypothetical protein
MLFFSQMLVVCYERHKNSDSFLKSCDRSKSVRGQYIGSSRSLKPCMTKWACKYQSQACHLVLKRPNEPTSAFLKIFARNKMIWSFIHFFGFFRSWRKSFNTYFWLNFSKTCICPFVLFGLWYFLNPDQSTIFYVKHKITLNLSTGLVKNRQGIWDQLGFQAFIISSIFVSHKIFLQLFCIWRKLK